MNNNKNIFQNGSIMIISIVVISLITLLLTFKLGVFVGYKKAEFSFLWGENYHKNFAGPARGFFMGPKDKDFINPHGIAGIVIKNELGTITIKGDDNTEKSVIVSEKTTVRTGNSTIGQTDLKIDDRIVIIGSPNEQGQIEAQFIRVFR